MDADQGHPLPPLGLYHIIYQGIDPHTQHSAYGSCVFEADSGEEAEGMTLMAAREANPRMSGDSTWRVNAQRIELRDGMLTPHYKVVYQP